MSAIDRFIGDTLRERGDALIDRQGREISATLHRRSGNLLDSRRAAVHGNTLTLDHPIYERFLDMRSLGGRKQKRHRIHNRFVYGTYAGIAERLMYGFTEEVAAAARNSFK